MATPAEARCRFLYVLNIAVTGGLALHFLACPATAAATHFGDTRADLGGGGLMAAGGGPAPTLGYRMLGAWWAAVAALSLLGLLRDPFKFSPVFLMQVFMLARSLAACGWAVPRCAGGPCRHGLPAPRRRPGHATLAPPSLPHWGTHPDRLQGRVPARRHRAAGGRRPLERLPGAAHRRLCRLPGAAVLLVGGWVGWVGGRSYRRRLRRLPAPWECLHAAAAVGGRSRARLHRAPPRPAHASLWLALPLTPASGSLSGTARLCMRSTPWTYLFGGGRKAQAQAGFPAGAADGATKAE